MFEKASRIKLRFETPKGLVTVEDLWDLPLTGNNANLDDIAKSLYEKLNDNKVDSFVLKSSNPDETVQLRFDVVTHIINVRLADAEKAEQARVSKEKKQRILNIISRKEDQTLEETSLDKLRGMVADL